MVRGGDMRTAFFSKSSQNGEDHDGQEQVPEHTITVHGKVYAGTEIKIGNQTIEVEQTMSKVRFLVRLIEGKKPDRKHRQEIVTKQL